jgi:hypothetical protein
MPQPSLRADPACAYSEKIATGGAVFDWNIRCSHDMSQGAAPQGHAAGAAGQAHLSAQEFHDLDPREGETLLFTPRKARVFVQAD